MLWQNKTHFFLGALWLLACDLPISYADQGHEAMEDALESEQEPRIGDILFSAFDTVTSPLKHLATADPTTPDRISGLHPDLLPDDPKSTSKKVNVLSLSGGGMRAHMSLVALKELEEQTGKRIIDLFDVIGGTSGGGLTALALSKGVSVDDLLKLYEEQGPEIFQTSLWRRFWTCDGLYGSKYYNTGLQKILEEKFGSTKLSEAQKPVLITYFDPVRQKSVFVSSEAAKSKKQENFPMEWLGEATSAAPMYFPPTEYIGEDGRHYPAVDGGVGGNNNPLLATYTEALRITRARPEDMVVVSIGTGKIRPTEANFEDYTDMKLGPWMSQLTDNLIQAPQDAALKFVRSVVPENQFFRFNPFIDLKDSAMDDVRPQTQMRLTATMKEYLQQKADRVHMLAQQLVIGR